ncbi:MAG TPA: hypothetical protein PL009_03565 [Flavipsychrobacter sp.]|nr:hypothetical protein [Flavipsychrobacter sp.]
MSEKITTELLRFITVRNPEPVPVSGVSTYPTYSVSSGSSLFSAMVTARSQNAEPAEILDDLVQIANDFKADNLNTENDWIGYFPQLKPFLTAFSSLVEGEINETTIRAIAAAHFEIETGLHPVADDEILILKKAWDHVFSYNIAGGQAQALEYALNIIRVHHLLKNIDEYPEEITQEQIFGTVLLPSEIFPLPKKEYSVDSEVAVDPNVITAEEVQQINEAYLKIESLQKSVEDLQQVYDGELEEARNIERSLRNVEFDEDGNPILSSGGFDSSTLGLLSDVLQNKLTTETQSIINERDFTENMTVLHVIEQLHKEQLAAGKVIQQKLKIQQNVVQYGNALIVVGTQFEPVAEDPASTTTDIPIEWVGPFDDSDGCKVKPLGVADYRRVEQTLICYKPGEVAHIENILKGESKERVTRRLQRSEETYSLLNDSERTEERDTISTDRFQLEKETSKVVQQDTSLQIGVQVQGQYGTVQIQANSNFAMSNSSTQSDASAVSYAKDVTNRALQRIVERTREERILKVLEEFEDTNKHGVDNTNGTSHVVGLYRWVDKIYKAKVVNYGKRLMFQFLVPDPAAFHRFAMKNPIESNMNISKPLDPVLGIQQIQTKFPNLNPLKSPADITTTNYLWWAGLYNVKVDAPPANRKIVGIAKSMTNMPNNGSSLGNMTSTDMQVPEGYKANLAYITTVTGYSPSNSAWLYISIGATGHQTNTWGTVQKPMNGETGTIPVAITGRLESFTATIEVECVCTNELLEEWKVKTFNAIMGAYEAKLAEYNNALAEAKAQNGIGIKGTNPLINRTIEHTELKKQSIRLLSSCAFMPSEAMKDNMWYDYPDFDCCEAISDGKYVQFVENCFEWPLMTYTFYPYFWSRKSKWKEIYQLDDTDTQFLEFLKAGYARVVVPVRPGFEEAALRYAADGTIWNGGSVPGINDPYYVSLIDEVRTAPGTVEDTWELRVPTTLTILQNDASGIAESGLPCNPDGI